MAGMMWGKSKFSRHNGCKKKEGVRVTNNLLTFPTFKKGPLLRDIKLSVSQGNNTKGKLLFISVMSGEKTQSKIEKENSISQTGIRIVFLILWYLIIESHIFKTKHRTHFLATEKNS